MRFGKKSDGIGRSRGHDASMKFGKGSKTQKHQDYRGGGGHRGGGLPQRRGIATVEGDCHSRGGLPQRRGIATVEGDCHSGGGLPQRRGIATEEGDCHRGGGLPQRRGIATEEGEGHIVKGDNKRTRRGHGMETGGYEDSDRKNILA